MKYDIPLLDYDTRFSLWQVKMHDALDKFGNKDSKSWSDEERRRDRKALSQIHLHLSNNILQEVLQEKTAAALWLKLESICMSKDLTSKMHLKMKLFLHKLQEGGSVPNHLTVFKEIVSDLQAMEVKYEDEDLGLILLCSLPSSFANFRDTILYSRDTLTLNDVCEALQAKEKMKQMVSSDGSASNGSALVARGRTEKKSNNGSRGKSSNGHHSRSKSKGRGNKFCYYCKKDNHRTGTYREKNKSNDDGKASVAASSSDNSDGDTLVAFAECANNGDEWILDSGASFHICINRDWFITYDSVQSGGSVRMGDDRPCQIVGIGSVEIKMHDGIVRTLTNVRHIPDMTKNLISLSTLDGKGYKYSGGDGVLKVSKGSLIVMKTDLKSANLYRVCGTTITDDAAVISNSLSNFDATNLGHMCLGHMSELGLQVLSKRGLLDGHSVSKLKFCEHCVFGKHKRVKFNTSTHTSKRILDYVHSDLWRPSRKPSHGGSRYMLTIIDDYSRKVWPYFLKYKSETFSAFKEWKVTIENQTEKKVKILRTDNGMEFCSSVKHYTIAYTPQQNGVAERMNRTIISRTRCMLSNAGLNKRFWAEAASTACYVINRSPSITLDKKTPIEVWSVSPTDYSQLKVFYCTAYAHVDNGKLEPRAIKYIFLVTNLVLKVINCGIHKLKRNVIFNETAMLSDNLSSDAPVEGQQKSSVQVELFIDVDNTPENDNAAVQDAHIPDNSPIVDDSAHKPVRRLIEECNIAYALSVAEKIEGNVEPSNYSEAITSADCNNSVTAMQDEMEPLEKNGTWGLVKLPKDKKPVRCKWIFKWKKGISPSKPARYKARLVAKGYSQIPVDTWLILVRSIGGLFSGFSDIYVFGKSRDRLVGYVDSDHAGDLDKRRSLTGYVFTVGGCAVSWKACLQATVALSTTEAEYMAISEACKETIWLRGLYSEFCGVSCSCVTIHCASQGAIYLTKGQMLHERTKHIDVRYHFIRGIIAEGGIKVRKISTHDNSAYMMTKHVSTSKFELCSSLVAGLADAGAVRHGGHAELPRVGLWEPEAFPLAAALLGKPLVPLGLVPPSPDEGSWRARTGRMCQIILVH
ncbi:hypothetical protein U9M48_001625 [Paspalum notatum var. saurae]|uniref:Integrase catalytic domain-containing protein n=1 Tax=Paspalum notatum var. saurae TaxID=547442 RepID=A0AAQ3PGM4_PASNO